ncbi:MAG: hypothetical protein ACREHG_08180 [Candidatus Saccharimonadales bacterium]
MKKAVMKAKHVRMMDFDTLLAELDREQHAGYLKSARSKAERAMVASSIILLDELRPYSPRKSAKKSGRALRALAVALVLTLIVSAGIAVYRASKASNPATYTLNK